jgi:hypothetical protein
MDDTVNGMEIPRFAAHLPPGKLFDWVWERHPGKRQNYHATPGIDAVRRMWNELTDDEIARIAGASDDPAVLDWIAGNGGRRSGVRGALVRNPALPFATLLDIVERGTNAAEREGIAKTRSNADLCRLLLAGHDMSGNPRHLISWIVGGSNELEDTDVMRLVAELDESHHGALVAELLRADPTTHAVPVETVLALVESTNGADLQENSWKSLGRHLATRGTARQVRRAMAVTSSAALRSSLVEHNKITLAQAFTRMDSDHRSAILRQIGSSGERRITLEESPLVADLADALGPSNKATRALLHGLKYEPTAVAWLVEHADPSVVATVAWHTDSDALLLSVLRRNPESHQLAGAHIWRVGRIWERLSMRTRSSIVGTFDALLLSNLAPGPVRDWIVSAGPVSSVNGLTLKKTEQRTLMDRVEKDRDPDLAWVAARIAERPRDRVRMAEIGLSSDRWVHGIKQWLRGASSGEIVKLWTLAPSERRNELGSLLVANLRASEETSWLDRLVGELRIEWQTAPGQVQEAAAHWLSSRCGSDPETWSALWTLYPEWTGTLAELVEAAATI